MFKSLFKAKPVHREALDLYALAVEQARQPVFYTTLGVEDRIDARFELYTLHVLLLYVRLRHDSPRSAELAQAMFDHYVSALDNVLRELGVGDVSVGKKMRKLGEALYGRMASYEKALSEFDLETLKAGIARNVYGQDDSEHAAVLADYAFACHAALASQTIAEIERRPNWAQISE
ncbi:MULTISPECIES: ubiquinol-cytochrome C chaperone family protein [unclassified Brevundimonas]|uniref:ubiquinol-cytochrome C chaperone family protein n=1 Tax=unclassified Brevundimonas TaxID=2622653 RepID=UPI0025BBECD7|nr:MULTISPECIES: ubiquinol-cytochrome C chaperone family protein [unclassified Brevundimonas]